MNSAPLLLRLRDCQDLQMAGGKALRLAQLSAAGFPVPDGFVVTAAAYRLAYAAGDELPVDLTREIGIWYRQLGSPVVAVRSSATAEDQADASMAGQYQTFLDVQGEADLVAAIRLCWSSVRSQRARVYLARLALDPADVTMAVVVQRLVPADVAGVLFTANPRTGAQDEMLLEASWGLGEAVVSGIVQPDTLLLDAATGRVKSATIAEKRTWIAPGSRVPAAVPEALRSAPSVTAAQVQELWRLGRRAAELFGAPQDLEWALQAGQVYLLQARPITTLAEAEAYSRCVAETRAQLGDAKRQGRGDWVRHNLAESLPHPTPLTWSVLQRFMSGSGGLGAMYRLAEFQPSAAAQERGFLELLAGRIYMDLSQAPGMFFADFPYRYDVDLLRANPDAAQGPPTIPAGSQLQQYRSGRRLQAIQRQLAARAQNLDQQLDGQLIPAFVQYVAAERQRDLRQLDTTQWLDLWRDRERRVLDEFAPQSLLPSLITAMALEQLRALVDELFWDEEPGELLNLLSSAGEPDLTLRASQGLFEIANGAGTLEEWLEAFGHRAPEEFDLASPRWRERPEAVRQMAERLRGSPSPLTLHEHRVAQAAQRLAALTPRLSAGQRRELDSQIRLVRRYVRFREDGKHYLMLGYQLLRDLAQEAGRRLELADGVFLLTFAELQTALTTGFAPLQLIEDRRRQRSAESKLLLPHVITEADFETLGQSATHVGGQRRPAFPISAGCNQGPARIVLSPAEAGELEPGYVLVCPSTDPSWTPLFVNAAALVLECGGTLSHGAVVARELGIPAVVCAGATRWLHDGEHVLVDGLRGTVVRLDAAETGSEATHDPASDAAHPAPGAAPEDPSVPRALVPPVASRLERRGAHWRNLALLAWSVYLAAAFLLPEEWLYQPSLATLDRLLWPLVAVSGKPAAVAFVAVGLALFTMLGQWLLTDNRRLRVAKNRAANLRQLALQLPAAAPRRQALLRLARPVQNRILAAAMLPLALILGPLVLILWWFPLRVDPAAWNARPGATAYVVATVDGEYTAPITLEFASGLRLDESTPATQSLPPLRATLEARLEKWQQTSDLSEQPWELQEAGRWIGQNLVTDLREYLRHDLPPQTLAWTLSTPGERSGRFRVQLSPEGRTPVNAYVVVGDAFPPERKEDLGDGKGPVQVLRTAAGASPIKLLKVTYFEPKKQGREVFWAPLAAWGRSWDAGWLLTYLLAYLPAMFLLRWLLRIP